MPLSLVDLCLLSVRNLIEDGGLSPRHELPVGVCQSLFDLIALHGQSNEPNCLGTFEQPGFLDCLERVDVLPKSKDVERDESQYPFRLVQCLAENSNLTANISTLNLYFVWNGKISQLSDIGDRRSESFFNVCQLIQCCPNLGSLSLRAQTLHFGSEFDRMDDLNDALIRAGVNRLRELSLSSINVCCSKFRTGPSPIFDGLQLLSLSEVSMSFDNWESILECCSDQLVILELIDFHTKCDNRLFPVELPALKSLRVDIDCPTNLGAIIEKCGQKMEGKLRFNSGDIGSNELQILEYLPINVELIVDVFTDQIDPLFFDFLEATEERITALKLVDYESTMDDQLIDFLLSTCPNLTSITLQDGWRAGGDNRFLQRLISDKERAAKLNHISLDSCNMSEQMVDLLCRNCINLQRLAICEYDRAIFLSDQSLQNLLRNGAKLESIKLSNADHLSDRGIVSLIKHCGSFLQEIDIGMISKSRDPSEIITALVQNCKQLVSLRLFNTEDLSVDFQEQLRRFMFYNLSV